jgi:hypothetical protein
LPVGPFRFAPRADIPLAPAFMSTRPRSICARGERGRRSGGLTFRPEKAKGRHPGTLGGGLFISDEREATPMRKNELEAVIAHIAILRFIASSPGSRDARSASRAPNRSERAFATCINVAASRSTAARSGSAAKAIPTATPRVEEEQRRL